MWLDVMRLNKTYIEEVDTGYHEGIDHGKDNIGLKREFVSFVVCTRLE